MVLGILTSLLTMNFLLSTFRVWLVKLEAIALLKPILSQKKIQHPMSETQKHTSTFVPRMSL